MRAERGRQSARKNVAEEKKGLDAGGTKWMGQDGHASDGVQKADDLPLCERASSQPAVSAIHAQVHYVLNNPPADWSGSAGFVTSGMIRCVVCKGGGGG